MPEDIQRKVQFGIESARGTAVAATRVGNGVLSQPNLNRGFRWSPVRSGTYLGRRKGSYGRFRPEFSYSEAASYEDLAWWGQLAWEGGVTGVSDSGTPTPAYEYQFDPDLTTDSLKSVTMEYGVAGARVDEVAGAMVNTIGLRIAPDNDNETAWMLDIGLKSLGPVSSSFTAALPLRDVEEIQAAGTLIYVDDDPDDLGTTLKSGWLIDASLTWNLNRHLKAFAENVTGPAPGKVGRGERTLDAQFTVEFDNYDEYTDFLSNTPVLRAIRLYREGSVIHTTVRKSVTIDLIGYWVSWAGSEREGNLTAVMQLQAGLIDAGYGNDGQIVVVNALSTLP